VSSYDHLVGEREVTRARTVGEAEVAAFAGVSGDFNPLHADAEFARETRFGGRIAHGLLVTSIASGLFTATRLSAELQPNLVAMLGVEARIRAPVRFDDTIRVDAVVTTVEDTKDPDTQVVTIERTVLNQDDDVVQTIRTPMLMRRPGRPPTR
jgi:acyl dehydratase